MKYKATSKAHHTRSHLFLVRVWLEELGNGKTEWRGKVKHVMSGEVLYFREWTTLQNFLQEALIKEASKNCFCPSTDDEGDDNNDSRDTDS